MILLTIPLDSNGELRVMLLTNIQRQVRGHSHPGKQHTLHSRVKGHHAEFWLRLMMPAGRAMPCKAAKLLQRSKRDLQILIHRACWGGRPSVRFLGSFPTR